MNEWKEAAMDRDELVLAALAAGGVGAAYSPVQVQKLLFLIDREIAIFVNGPHFAFHPYDYGPFDSEVYATIEHLKIFGYAEVVVGRSYRQYLLTQPGMQAGLHQLQRLPVAVSDYITELAKWVLGLNFSQLVAAIYNRYPEMKINSVFVE